MTAILLDFFEATVNRSLEFHAPTIIKINKLGDKLEVNEVKEFHFQVSLVILWLKIQISKSLVSYLF